MLFNVGLDNLWNLFTECIILLSLLTTLTMVWPGPGTDIGTSGDCDLLLPVLVVTDLSDLTLVEVKLLQFDIRSISSSWLSLSVITLSMVSPTCLTAIIWSARQPCSTSTWWTQWASWLYWQRSCKKMWKKNSLTLIIGSLWKIDQFNFYFISIFQMK